MKFLDLNGLTHFFGKVKTWAGNNYLSLKGGTINGNVNISGNVSALQFKKTNGTSTQVLIADGSVKGINSANGIAGLDANGYVPLTQLGNLDTTVAEVVTALPTTNIKKHIYLVKDASGVTQNQYEEYLYTGDISAAYDASKWEKLGDFRATVDLTDYAKKSEAVNSVSCEFTDVGGSLLFNNINGERISNCLIGTVSSTKAGLMIPRDKEKLNRLDISSIDGTDNIYIGCLVTADGSGLVSVDSSDNSISVSLPTVNNIFTLDFSLPAATSEKAGLMVAADKTKLDGISSGATADSAITTGEIDALFA